MYFKKLNIKIDIPDYEVGEKQLEYGINIDDKFNGLWYSDLKVNDQVDLIPEKYKSDFYLSFLEANSFYKK